LAEMIELKRNELERISGRHDHTLQAIISLFCSCKMNILFLRKQHRFLSSFAEQLSREGLVRNKWSDSILSTLHNVEEQRKKLLNKIESPSWEIKHHFHLLSFEHFRGNQQPHLLEIAEVLPARLQIAAISHFSHKKNEKLLSLFNIKQKERDLLYKKLSQIEKKRNLTSNHLKDYKKMMVIIKKNIGEKRLNKYLKEMEGKQTKTTPSKQNKNKIETIQNKEDPNMDRFRMQYLSGIGIRKSKKVEFNLSEFVLSVNKFLGISEHETRKELIELEDNSDSINPITGELNHANIVKSEEKKEEKKEIETNEEIIEKQQKENKKNTKPKRKLLTEKPLRQNILNIIDKNKFVFILYFL